jgi:ABC-type spermidine/putrescine transport system permease subunit II
MTPEINAISTLIFVFSVALILFWYHLRTRGQRSAEMAADVLPMAILGEEQ